MKKHILLYITLLFVLVLAGCPDQTNETIRDTMNETTTEEQEKVYRTSLVAVGDNLIHDAIYEAAYKDGKYNFMPFYEPMASYIQTFDLAFINQETMLGGVEIGLSSYPSFNSPVEVGEALIETGFNLFSIANNHTLDRGERAILNTIDFLESKAIYYSGARATDEDTDVVIFEKNGITFGFVAYTMLTNGQVHPEGKTYLANVYSREKAENQINEVRSDVDFMIVSMHWGDEYVDYPNDTQKQEARFLANLGVDVIIGHHAHVIQPIEWLETDEHKTLVIYSLGNFLSAQIGVDRNIGMALELDFVKDENETLTIENIRTQLLYHYRTDDGYSVRPLLSIDETILDQYMTYYEQKKSLIQTYMEVEVD